MSAPYGLTVGQLKAVLNSMPDRFDDKLVVLSRDEEGNGFDTLSEIAVGWYRSDDEREFQGFVPTDDDTWDHLEYQATLSYTTDEDGDADDEDARIELDEHDHPAICLWP